MSNLPYKNSSSKERTLITDFKVNSKKQELFISYFYLVLKVCFSLVAIVSLIKLGYSSKLRSIRLKEIRNSFLYEKSRFKVLSKRFDDLFSFEGQQRFMKDQDQMISRDIIRVIWR